MYLPGIEHHPDAQGSYADLIRMARSAGRSVPGIWHLFAFKPARTQHLEAFTDDVMRGPSPLSWGFRELIAARTSARNHCLF